MMYIAGTAYRSNGPKYEEFQRECDCRTRKRRRPAARRGRGRGPPYRSRRRSHSGARNCSRWSPHPRSPTPRKGSRRRLRGIAAPMPFSVEYSLSRARERARARKPQSPLSSPLAARSPLNKTRGACARTFLTEIYHSRAASILSRILRPFVVEPRVLAHLLALPHLFSFHGNSRSFVCGESVGYFACWKWCSFVRRAM